MASSERRTMGLLMITAFGTLGAILMASADKKARQIYEAENLSLDEKLKQMDQKKTCYLRKSIYCKGMDCSLECLTHIKSKHGFLTSFNPAYVLANPLGHCTSCQGQAHYLSRSVAAGLGFLLMQLDLDCFMVIASYP